MKGEKLDQIRQLHYWEALSEGLVQAMGADPSVFVMGIGATAPPGLFGTTKEAYQRFGDRRVFDIPISENAITGLGIGAALAGMRPVMVHARNDFMLVSMDQLVNHAAKWSYMSGGELKVPFTIRAIVGRSWGQGAQHSQSLQALFAHVPGLKVVMPATPYDAKGLLMSSIREGCPVIFIEHRTLYNTVGPVPSEPYLVPLGQSFVRRQGKDVTVAAVSLMVVEALRAADLLAGQGIELEVIDLRTLEPLDLGPVLESVKKTGRLVVADTGWKSCGVAGEIAARVAEEAFAWLKGPIRRIALPHTPTPCCSVLEQFFYPGAEDIVRVSQELVGTGVRVVRGSVAPLDKGFVGPF